MTQAFLNKPTIEEAHTAYLTRWHLESVQSAWKDSKGKARKPTLAQFKKRFGDAYDARQARIAKRNGGVLVVEHSDEQVKDATQQLSENLLALLQGKSLIEEPEDEILGSEVEGEVATSSILAILNKHKAPAKSEVETPKFVKPENFDELPRSGQVYFFLHRAQEAGFSYAIVPLKRGVAAEAISQIKDDGRSYKSVASALAKA